MQDLYGRTLDVLARETGLGTRGAVSKSEGQKGQTGQNDRIEGWRQKKRRVKGEGHPALHFTVVRPG